MFAGLVVRSGPNGAYQYRYFGGFRLALAALVMLQHFAADLAPEQLAKVLAPYAVGGMAVLAFFALSGFVIAEAVDCVYRKRPVAFLTNRLLRIMPHFLLAMVLSMVAHAFFRYAGGVHLWRSQPSFPRDAFAIRNVLLNFVGVVPAVDRLIDYNFLDIAWAVRVEMAFYLIMLACILIGRRLPWARGFALVAGCLVLVLIPVFWLAVKGHGPAMLAFTPYFTFGAGLYFGLMSSRAGQMIAVLSIPAMLWQYANTEVEAPQGLGETSSWIGNLIILTTMLGMMVFLIFAGISKGRKIDRALGNITYPLYLYHEVILIVVLTLTTRYSYVILAIGTMLSVLVATGLAMLVDPFVGYYRDRVRARRLPPSERLMGGSGSAPMPLLSEPRPTLR